jgi:hypothetical protein
MSFIDNLDTLAKEIASALRCANRELYISKVGSFVNALSSNIEFTISSLARDVLINLYPILTTNFADGKTLGSLLETISQNHIHRDGNYKCDFHQESLMTHLLTCALVVAEASLEDPICSMVTLAALLHDIGKYAAVEKISRESESTGCRRYTAFPLHGELGGLTLQGIDLDIPSEMWKNICRVTSIHMNCGYHADKPTDLSEAAIAMLSFEHPDVQKMIAYLSLGDRLGRFAHDGSVDKSGRAIFNRYISAVTRQSIVPAIFTESDNPLGTIITLLGPSCAGKTTLSRQLIEYLSPLNKRVTVVSRDTIMCMRASSNSKITLEAVQQFTPVTGKEYAKLYQIYKQKKLARSVNDSLKNVIHEILQRNEICILDTVATLFMPASEIYPPSVREAVRINIFLNRMTPLNINDVHKLGLNSIEELRKITGAGSDDLLKRLPFPENGSMRKSYLQTIFTAASVDELSRPEALARSHINFSVSWNFERTFEDYTTVLLPFLTSITNVVETNAVCTDRLSLSELVTYLYQKYSGNIARIKTWFFDRSYIFKSTGTAKGFFVVYYQEGKKVKWYYKWARQARGTILYINNNVATVISQKLQRGAECLTMMHHQAGIDATENTFFDDDLKDFDENQIYTMKALRYGEENYNGYLSSKSDGSLLAVTIFHRDPQIFPVTTAVTDAITEADEFARTVYSCCSERNWYLILSSQRTLFLGENIQGYTITALAVALGVYTQDEIEVIAKNTSAAKVAATVINKFVEKIDFFLENSPELEFERTGILTLSFETICKNRKDPWGQEHLELAVSYPISNFIYLGVTCGNFIPHFATPEASAIFNQPRVWRISRTATIFEMLSSLEEVIAAKISEQEFLQRHPSIIDASGGLDYEGFVLYTVFPKFDTGCQRYDYSKIKTPFYYRVHKITDGSADIDTLLECAKGIAGERFATLSTIVSWMEEFPSRIAESIFVTLEDLRHKAKNISSDSNPQSRGIANKPINEIVRIWLASRSGLAAEIFTRALNRKCLLEHEGHYYRRFINDIHVENCTSIEEIRQLITSANKSTRFRSLTHEILFLYLRAPVEI